MLKTFMISCLCVMTLSLSPAHALQTGEAAPLFSVKDIHGKTQSLAAYKGKIVVLEWNNPYCPFVKKHYDSGNMQQLQYYAVKQGVVWLTVNSSAKDKQGYMDNQGAIANLAVVKSHATAYLLDPEATLGRLYGAKSTPHMFVIDSKGALAYAGAIDDTPTPDKEDIKTAKNYVKAAINDLLAGKPVVTPQTRAYGCSIKYGTSQ